MAFDPESYPYRTVVFITDTIGQGSGVLISPDEVLTASHVVWSSDNGTASNIVVTPAHGMGSAPFGSAAGTSFHYNPVQDPNSSITKQQSQSDYALIHLSQPFANLGTMGLSAGFPGGPANVTGYPVADKGQMETSAQNVTLDANFTLLDGISIGKGSSGGPVWVTDRTGAPFVVGVVSSEKDDSPGSTGSFTQITAAAFNQIETWLQRDEAFGSGLAIFDTTTGKSIPAAIQTYTGPVPGLQDQYINLIPDNLNIGADSPNWFIHGGSGNDAIAVNSGSNVLDGGTGSNFLVGGSGSDTFFVDDRGLTGDIWSTVSGFHFGDAATVWGVSPQDFSLAWIDGAGAAGYTGLTLHATSSGRPTASLTLAATTARALCG